MANAINNDSTVANDKHIGFGGSDDFKIEFNSGNSRLEIKDAADNVMGYFVDNGTTGDFYVTGNLHIDNGIIDSGTDTPTGTGVANVASVGDQDVQYMRVGDVVTVSARCQVTPTAGSTFTQIRVDFPVASNIAGSKDCVGAGSFTISSTPTVVAVYGDGTNDEVLLSFISNGTAEHNIFYTYTYQVI